jgi:hypothetical protein
MPLQRAAEPTAERQRIGKPEPKDGRCIVDAPTAENHDEHCERIEPMRDS